MTEAATKQEPRRRPPRAMFALLTLALLFGVLEVGQRISDARKREKRAATAGFRRESTLGTRLDDAEGGLVLETDDLRGFRLRPAQEAAGVTVNARGFRGEEMPSAKPAGERRVLVLGGSAAYGYLIDDTAAIFPALLERRLAAGPPRGAAAVRVWNCGIVGYDSAQELALLAHDLVDAAPDVVVLFDGWNDFQNSGRTPPGEPLRTGTFRETEARTARLDEPVRGLLRCSAFYRGLERRAAAWRLDRAEAAARAAGGTGVYAERPDAIERYRRNLVAMARLARGYGARTVIVPQPEVHLRAPPIDAEKAIRDAERAPGYTAYATQTYPRFRDAARAVAEAEGAGYLDATRAFDGRPDTAFIDDCHLTPRGMEIVAEALEPAVRGLLESR